MFHSKPIVGATPRRPDVFISATSRDLKSVRQAVKTGLLSIGCYPVEQEHFAPHGGSVSQMIEEKIRSANAMIHIVGECYGAEPDPDGGKPRRSYTQMEYHLARELGKSVYVFVCPESFPFDPHDPEPEDKARLQRQHRELILAGTYKYEEVHDQITLNLRVRELQLLLEGVRGELAEERRGWRKASVVIASAVGLIAVAGVVVAARQFSRQSKVESTVASVNAGLLATHQSQHKFYEQELQGWLLILEEAGKGGMAASPFAGSAWDGLHRFRIKVTEPWASDLRFKAGIGEAEALRLLGRDSETATIFTELLASSSSDPNWSRHVQDAQAGFEGRHGSSGQAVAASKAALQEVLRSGSETILRLALDQLDAAQKSPGQQSLAVSAEAALRKFQEQPDIPADLRLRAAAAYAEALHLLRRDAEAEDVFKKLAQSPSNIQSWQAQVATAYETFLTTSLGFNAEQAAKRVRASLPQ